MESDLERIIDPAEKYKVALGKVWTAKKNQDSDWETETHMLRRHFPFESDKWRTAGLLVWSLG